MPLKSIYSVFHKIPSNFFSILKKKLKIIPDKKAILTIQSRTSRPEVFCEKGGACNFKIKKRLWHRCFPVNFAKFLRTPFLIEHLRWLLLYSQKMFCESLLQRDFPLKSHHEMFLKFFWTVTFKTSSKWRLLDKVFWNLLIKLLKESQPYDSALT